WGDVADGGVDAPPIVIAFDIGEQVAPRGIAIGVFAGVDELGFQSVEETLHWRIVLAVALAAHRLDDSGGVQDVAVVAGGVLAAAVGMMDQACSRALPLDCHGERGDGEFGTHVIAHGPTNHLAAEQVEDYGQVEPALAGRNVGDIGQPDLIGLVGDKVLIQQVCRHREGMLAVGCAHAIAARRPSPETVLAHDPLDPLAADGLTLGSQFGVDARRSIRSRSFSRRSREISAAGSGTGCGADAGIARSADPASRPPLPLRQLRSIEGEMPSSLAIWLNGRPLLTSRAIASCLNSSVK